MPAALPGVRPEVIVAAIDGILHGVGTLRIGNKFEVLDAYLRWATDAGATLRRLISAADVDRLILTPGYWALLGIDPVSNNALQGVVHIELDERERALRALRADLERTRERWSSLSGVLLVPDTNVFLEHENQFDQIPWAEFAIESRGPINVVIPMLVVDELDQAKSDRARSRARACLRDLNRLFVDPLAPAPLLEEADRPVVVHLLLDDVTHVRLSDPDMEIATRAIALGDMVGVEPSIVTFDTGMALRSRALGLEVRHLDGAHRR